MWKISENRGKFPNNTKESGKFRSKGLKIFEKKNRKFLKNMEKFFKNAEEMNNFWKFLENTKKFWKNGVFLKNVKFLKIMVNLF